MKTKIDPQLLIAIGVLIASFSALFVYMRQAQIMNDQTGILLQQSKANAWPHIDISLNVSTQNDSIKSFQISVINKGTGPAIVNSVRLSIDDVATRNWEDFFDKANKPDSISSSWSASSISNSVISPRESILIFSPYDPELRTWIFNNASKMKMEICYRSVFDDYWMVTREGFSGMEQSSARSLDACSLSEDELFIN